MRKLSKEQAEAFAEATSSICLQGNAWVFKEWDMERGTERLTRGLTHKTALKKLKSRRKERVEQLLREEHDADAYILRVWHSHPSWDGKGIWQFDKKYWYTSNDAAQEALNKQSCEEKIYQIYKTTTAKVPGSFKVA